LFVDLSIQSVDSNSHFELALVTAGSDVAHLWTWMTAMVAVSHGDSNSARFLRLKHNTPKILAKRYATSLLSQKRLTARHKPFFGARQKYIFGLWRFFDKKIEFFGFFHLVTS
jgi:hypothetical protein